MFLKVKQALANPPPFLFPSLFFTKSCGVRRFHTEMKQKRSQKYEFRQKHAMKLFESTQKDRDRLNFFFVKSVQDPRSKDPLPPTPKNFFSLFPAAISFPSPSLKKILGCCSFGWRCCISKVVAMMKRAPSEKQEPNFVRMQAKKGIIEQHLKSSLGSDGRLASIWILQGCRLSCLLEYDIEAFLDFFVLCLLH